MTSKQMEEDQKQVNTRLRDEIAQIRMQNDFLQQTALRQGNLLHDRDDTIAGFQKKLEDADADYMCAEDAHKREIKEMEKIIRELATENRNYFHRSEKLLHLQGLLLYPDGKLKQPDKELEQSYNELQERFKQSEQRCKQFEQQSAQLKQLKQHNEQLKEQNGKFRHHNKALVHQVEQLQQQVLMPNKDAANANAELIEQASLVGKVASGTSDGKAFDFNNINHQQEFCLPQRPKNTSAFGFPQLGQSTMQDHSASNTEARSDSEEEAMGDFMQSLRNRGFCPRYYRKGNCRNIRKCRYPQHKRPGAI